jgi:hypothetical protein
VSTLGQLKTSVDSWLIRDDVAVSGADFPQILLVAESEIARDVFLQVQETRVTINFTARAADLPADYNGLRDPFIDSEARKFEYQTPQAFRESSNYATGRTGAFFTIEGGGGTVGDERAQILLSAPPSPSAPLDLEILYWARFAGLTDDADTNWLLRNHFDVYLYATLRSACEYIQEDMLEDRYLAKYERAVTRTNKHENRKRFGAMPKQRYGAPRGVV